MLAGGQRSIEVSAVVLSFLLYSLSNSRKEALIWRMNDASSLLLGVTGQTFFLELR